MCMLVSVCVCVCVYACVHACVAMPNKVTQKSKYPRTGILQISMHSKNNSMYLYEKSTDRINNYEGRAIEVHLMARPS